MLFVSFQGRYGIHDLNRLLLLLLYQKGVGSMVRKEYSMIEIVDVLRRYQHGDTIRVISRWTGIDRDTARKYLRMAEDEKMTQIGNNP